ncbi:MAG: hypothetical protein D6E12_04415 [Desulfovibrio sp.]|nr:MAG: hypothetical protein D6E12_04415 [Desulfovibrio sp.]
MSKEPDLFRVLIRMLAVALLVALAVVMLLVALGVTPPPSIAQPLSWEVYIQGETRQLRSLALNATGLSDLAAEADIKEHRAAALADAKRRALAMARAELEQEIARRNPDVRIQFLGEPNAPEQAVFIHRVTELSPTEGQNFQVEILAEVAYVVLLPDSDASLQDTSDEASMPALGLDATDSGTSLDNQGTLDLTPPEGAQADPAEEGGDVDQAAMEQGYNALTQELENKLQELLGH